MLIKPYRQNKFVRFHAIQSFLFGVAVVIVNIALESVFPNWRYTLTPVRPFHNAVLLYMLTFLLTALFKVRMKVPLIGQVAERF
jgi:uncharacterized membrane protein